MLYKQINGIANAGLYTAVGEITEHEFLYSLSRSGSFLYTRGRGVGILFFGGKDDLH